MNTSANSVELTTARRGGRYAPIIGYLGGRKFIVVVATLITATWLVALKIIEPVIYRDIMVAVVAAYVASNVWQKRVEATNPEG